MKNKKHIQNYTFLSNQTKQALFYAIQEAINNKSNVVTSKILFYGLLKANPSLLTNLIINICKKTKFLSEDITYYMYKCKLSLKNETTQNSSMEESEKIALSKSVRDLFTLLLTDAKNKKTLKQNKNTSNIVTTFSIFNELLKRESLKTWFKDEIFLQKK